MRNFTKRSTETELMDDPAAPEYELRQNLRELEIINRYLGGYKVVLSAIQRLQLHGRLSVMDLGSGAGDTLRAIAQWARTRRLQAQLTGVDYNPVMIRYGREQSQAYPEIRFEQLDIFDPKLNDCPADIVTCSLFCHHFERDSLIRLLKRMHELAAKAVVINDLHRHWLAYYSIKWLTGIFSKTYMVKNDAAVSVARAFQREDWEEMLAAAGISHYTLEWKWAFRWLLIIHKQTAKS